MGCNCKKLTPEQEAKNRASFLEKFKAAKSIQASLGIRTPSLPEPINTPPNKPAKPYGIFNVLKDTISGTVQYASEEKQQNRKAVCKNCKFYVPLTDQCSDCLCIISQKVRYEKSSCPKGRW